MIKVPIPSKIGTLYFGALIELKEGIPDIISVWIKAYMEFEVTTWVTVQRFRGSKVVFSSPYTIL